MNARAGGQAALKTAGVGACWEAEDGSVARGGQPASDVSSRMTRVPEHLELRWYGDWRWRFTSDHCGMSLWCGPMAVYWWRRLPRR